jgi:hypothetical protein
MAGSGESKNTSFKRETGMKSGHAYKTQLLIRNIDICCASTGSSRKAEIGVEAETENRPM